MELKIFSTENDSSTNEVIDWITYLNDNCEFIRVNDNFYNRDHEFSIQIPKQITNREFVWLRKWNNYRYINNNNFQILFQEQDSLSKYLLRESNNCFLINNLNDFGISKPVQLDVASKKGINIPSTLISNNKEDLKQFIKKYKNIITKPLFEPIIRIEEERSFASYTRILDDNEVNELPNTFQCSLFQELIEKKYEIRSFYLDKRFYSMAIFSQTDDQTKVDFRNYNLNKPNRTIPYKLPAEIENKLIEFSEELELKSGSFDLIKSKDGKYIFLEVNPFGQFGMVSKPCNYQIEKQIANYIITKVSEERK